MTSGHAIATLVVFILSIFFVIHPVSIPARGLPPIPINLTTAPILAILLLWAAQCIDPVVIRNGFVGTEGVKPYNILILFFSLAYMAITLDVTGILRAAAFWVSNKSGNNGWKLYFYFYLLLTFVSILIGNDPVILSGTAFLVYYTNVAELDPWAWIIAEFAAANTASMVLFVGNPTNVVICEGFSVNNAAFTAYTILPFLACNVFCFVALAFQFRKQVPRKLNAVRYRDPRTVLRDPVGAWVGSFMLGATLILCLVVSFFGIDVWMISLPFALAKFVFDLGWDYYHFSRGKVMIVDENLEEPSSEKQNGDGDSRHSLPSPTDVEQSQMTVSSTDSDKTKVDDRDRNNVTMDENLEKDLSDTQNGDGESRRSLSPPTNMQQSQSTVSSTDSDKTKVGDKDPPLSEDSKMPYIFRWHRAYMNALQHRLLKRFPTFMTALPRLPFALVPFAFSQFILIEALNHQGWVTVFGNWLVRASHNKVHPTIWLIGVLGVILCNISGTNIGATILLTKVVRAAALPYEADRAAAIALAVASNIGAVSFTFSASLAGLLWRSILEQKGIHVQQRKFAFWNLLPLLVMTAVGLGIVSAEMAVLFQRGS